MGRCGGIRGILASPLFAITALSISGCASLPSGVTALPAAEAPQFDAIRFFEGRSEGHGTLSKVFSGDTVIRVESTGTVAQDGSLMLEQRVMEGDKPARTRRWIIREVAPNQYAGTLTDASGPVTGETRGNQLTLRFTMEGGFPVTQVLTLSPDGQRAYNVMRVRKLGVTVAVLAEDIRRIP